MELLLIRHGIATPAGGGLSDADRPLSPEGDRQMAEVAAGLRAMGLSLGVLLHSPLRRAVETARHLAPLAVGPGRMTPLLARPPGSELLAALGVAGVEAGEERLVAAVGHQPSISALTAILFTGDDALGDVLAFSPATVAWLSGRPVPGGMALRALLPPEAVAARARG